MIGALLREQFLIFYNAARLWPGSRRICHWFVQVCVTAGAPFGGSGTFGKFTGLPGDTESKL